MTISAVGILANFSQEIHHWTVLETTISQTIFWTRIRVKFFFSMTFDIFLIFHDFSMTFHDHTFFHDFPWLSMTVGTRGVGTLCEALSESSFGPLDSLLQPWGEWSIGPLGPLSSLCSCLQQKPFSSHKKDLPCQTPIKPRYNSWQGQWGVINHNRKGSKLTAHLPQYTRECMVHPGHTLNIHMHKGRGVPGWCAPCVISTGSVAVTPLWPQVGGK